MLDDIDRDYSNQTAQLPEEELLDIYGNEEIATLPAVLSDYVLTQFPPYQHVDCMDPMSHQSISILFSSTCHDGQRHQTPCVPPCIIQMLYYGHNDISLGDFLKRYCFRPDYRCQTCSSEMTKHQRHIIHGPAALHISVQHLDIPIPRSNDGIFTWLACKHCTLCTPYIKMADSSLLFSFAKFLELKFHCDQFVTRLHCDTDSTSCQHTLHRHYLHYFSFRNKIACFQPAEISILEVMIPPTVIVINTPHSEYHHSFAKEIKHIEHITEGVCYRIKQRLLSYNMEPVSALVKDHIASSKGERDAFRGRIKLLKEMVVHGGFLESGGEEMSEDRQEAEFAALQDGIAEIKRALTEFVTCWNIELESLDSKIRIFHSRRDAAASRTSDRDSPFIPMAAEIPASRGAGPRSLLRPDQEDNLLLNTPLSSPPDSSSLEDCSKVHGPSLNREAGDVAVVLTPDSQTEVGEEVKISGDTRSTQDTSSRSPYDTDKNFSSNSDRIVSSSEDLLTFDSRISSSSLSGEGGGGGRKEMEGEATKETTVALRTGTTVTTVEPKGTKPRQEGAKISTTGKASTNHSAPSDPATSVLPLSHAAPSAGSESSLPVVPGSAEMTKKTASKHECASEMDWASCVGGGSANVTPTIVVSEDELGEGEGWWSERGSSPASAGGRSDSPFKTETTPDSEGRAGYQSVRTLVVSAPGQWTPNPPHPTAAALEENQSDGVGLFNRFRVTKETDVRDDPNKFYLVDAAEELSTAANATPPLTRTPDVLQTHHHGPRPHKRPGAPPRKNGSSSAPPPSDSDGRSSRGVREKERAAVPVRPFQKLIPPFDLNEHHNMHKSLKIPIAIYEKEPTSLIAYALSSREYAQEYWSLVERRHTTGAHSALLTTAGESRHLSRPSSPKAPKKQADHPLSQLPPPTKTSAIKQAYQELKRKGALNAMNVFTNLSAASDRPEPHDRSGDESRRIEAALSSKSSHSSSSTPSKSSHSNSSSFPATDQSTVQEDGEGFRWNTTTGDHASPSGPPSKAGHISLEFTAPDRSSSIFCKVYFAEEFQHLRELVFPSGEDRYIRSLSRCVKFDAKGGKSRSTFCKVIDDRFIMKQIKAVEISSFEQIAPLYFEHITTALESKRPLALAKIIGVYTIGYRNTRTGNSKRLDVIVMENLLYGRKSSKVFDLKGSMRSRYIDPSKDSSNDVLLDENFLNHICYSPVYVHPHSKAVLMRAIQEDAQFLAQNAIMDYSLLTCIDDQTGELVVGIIDYVRTFTLDKRLEMYIKKTAGRVLPTVVYPELYRKRFCEAIERYFTVVPDKWTYLGADI